MLSEKTEAAKNRLYNILYIIMWESLSCTEVFRKGAVAYKHVAGVWINVPVLIKAPSVLSQNWKTMKNSTRTSEYEWGYEYYYDYVDPVLVNASTLTYNRCELDFLSSLWGLQTHI